MLKLQQKWGLCRDLVCQRYFPRLRYLARLSQGSVTQLKLPSRSLLEPTEILRPGGEGRKRVSGNFCERFVLVLAGVNPLSGTGRTR